MNDEKGRQMTYWGGSPASESPSVDPIVHTPGPWKVANNSRSVLAGAVKINQQAGPAAQSAAVEARTEFTLRANAQLIAAAPELLEALQMLLGLVEANEARQGFVSHQGNVARLAITKATGKVV